MNTATRAELINAVTEYDRKEKAKAAKASRGRGYYNPWALPQYIRAVDNAAGLMADGASLRPALCLTFSGRLLDACLRAVGEQVSTCDEQRRSL